MRLAHGLALALIPFAFSIGCTGGGGGGDDDGDDQGDDTVDPPAEGFQIITPEIVIAPGEEVTYCYYTTVTLEQATGIKKWSSVMTPGSHHLIVFFTDSADEPDETLTEDCGFFGGSGGGFDFPIWAYSAGTPEYETAMPAGVGMQVKQTQNLFVQMHYLNTSPTEPIDVHVTINAETYAPDEEYTPAAAYVTFAGDISIPGGVGMEGSVEHTCDVPAGRTFFLMNTHSHRRSVETWIKDGDTEIFKSDDWEHPSDPRVAEWMNAPHYQFSGRLTYHCDYVNDIAAPVGTGDSAATDEMCMAVGYSFPATQPTICYNDFTF
jgi:hypothetical protein